MFSLFKFVLLLDLNSSASYLYETLIAVHLVSIISCYAFVSFIAEIFLPRFSRS